MKLLRKTLKSYLVFSVIIFAISVPVFYVLVQNLWISDVDDTLIYQKENIINGIERKDMDSLSIVQFSEALSKTDVGISITQLAGEHVKKDSVYNSDFYENIRLHVEPYRELKSIVNANNRWYKITVRKDLVESKDLIQGIVFTQAILFLLFLIGTLVLNSYFSKKTWRPFYFIVSKLQSYKIDSDQPIETTGSDIEEFNALNQSVLKLTENNIQLFKSQKEFTENAAHELRTPLAVLKNQMDLLVQDTELNKNQAEIIGKINKNINLLIKLNKNLLMLSKIDNNQFGKIETINLSEVVEEVQDMFQEHMLLKNIRFIFNVTDKGHAIVSNKELMHSLLTNLMSNAIKYNINGGLIIVDIKTGSLCMTNTGIDKPLQTDRIFERFYKQSHHVESIGLGLAIVKKICDTLGFEITYQFTLPNKHSFIISF